jgi:hypothetical protein
MNVQAQNAPRISSPGFTRFLLLLTAVLGFAALGRAQETANDDIRFAREFLRALYPEMTGKGYSLTVETALSYDDLASKPAYLIVDVGAGPKFARLECCLGGVFGGSIPLQLPTPPELGPPSPPQAPAPSSLVRPISKDDKKLWDSEGRAHWKQYLHAGFGFDQQGRLADFTAEGSALDHGDAGNELRAFVDAHPGISDADIVAKLKQSGVKYGPDDQQEFSKDLPLKKLELFLGKLELLSVGFLPLDEKRDNLDLDMWPFWRVRALATRKDGRKVEYEMAFEPWKGDIINLFIATSTADKTPKRKQ